MEALTPLPVDAPHVSLRCVLLNLPGALPQLAHDAWVAPGAVLIGNVRLASGASVWYGCVARGDGDLICVGEGSNVQDGTIIHADPGRPVTIGARVTIGHRAVLHGCTIDDEVLVGMGAIVLNGARIGTGSLIGAGALVTEGMQVPPGSLVLGAPGRVRRATTADETSRILANAASYTTLMAQHRAALAQGPGKVEFPAVE